jgi:hypothetical protein
LKPESVDQGFARLPGAGYEAIHPELKTRSLRPAATKDSTGGRAKDRLSLTPLLLAGDMRFSAEQPSGSCLLTERHRTAQLKTAGSVPLCSWPVDFQHIKAFEAGEVDRRRTQRVCQLGDAPHRIAGIFCVDN